MNKYSDACPRCLDKKKVVIGKLNSTYFLKQYPEQEIGRFSCPECGQNWQCGFKKVKENEPGT